MMEYDALLFAIRAHDGQYRKVVDGYKEPYICHPVRVARMVEQVGGNVAMIKAALLHDVIEDCGVSRETINTTFGPEVGRMVWALSDMQTPDDGNRATRQANTREKLAAAAGDVQTIKLADMIDNTSSIVSTDPAFAKVYLPEKRAVIVALTKGNGILRAGAMEVLEKAEQTLREMDA